MQFACEVGKELLQAYNTMLIDLNCRHMDKAHGQNCCIHGCLRGLIIRWRLEVLASAFRLAPVLPLLSWSPPRLSAAAMLAPVLACALLLAAARWLIVEPLAFLLQLSAASPQLRLVSLTSCLGRERRLEIG